MNDFRNGRPLERSTRIKRYFDGKTAKIEILKVKASDAGEYTCVATNVLGSTKNSCQVNNTLITRYRRVLVHSARNYFLTMGNNYFRNHR